MIDFDAFAAKVPAGTWVQEVGGIYIFGCLIENKPYQAWEWAPRTSLAYLLELQIGARVSKRVRVQPINQTQFLDQLPVYAVDRLIYLLDGRMVTFAELNVGNQEEGN